MLRRSVILPIAAAVPAIVLSGCGSGAKRDSTFRGAYRSVYTIPSEGETGVFSFSVEQKGDMSGSFTDSNNKVSAFSGSIGNDGKFSGTVTDGNNRYDTRGTLSTSGTVSGGDFRQTRNGQEVQGSFTLASGATTGTGGNGTGTNGTGGTGTGTNGTGGTGIPTTTTNSTFRGAYSGSYNVPGLSGYAGVTSFSVNGGGQVIGSITRINTSGVTETGAFTGSIENDGSLTATATFGTETLNFTGTLNQTTDGSTSGNFSVAQGGQNYSGTFGKTETQATGDSPYQGSYRGTYGIPENQETGNVSFTVDPRGTLTGFFSQSANQPVGTFAASISNDGTFSGTVKYDASSGRTDRAITGKLGTSAVSNGGRAGDFVMTIDGANRPGNFEVSVGGSEVDSIYRGSYSGTSISNAVTLSATTGTVLDQIYNTANTVFAGNSLQPQDGNLLVLVPTQRITTARFTIDKQGTLVGTLGNSPFAVRITNDGRLYGTWNGFTVNGAASRQQVRDLDNTTFEDIKDAAGNTIGVRARYTYADVAGITGDFQVATPSGIVYGSFFTRGGNAEGAVSRKR